MAQWGYKNRSRPLSILREVAENSTELGTRLLLHGSCKLAMNEFVVWERAKVAGLSPWTTHMREEDQVRQQ